MAPAKLEFLTSYLRSRHACAPPSATRCSSATTRRRCSSGWSTRTCSSSHSTIGAGGSATTTSSGKCFTPSSSDASRGSPRRSTAGPPSWCEANGHPEARDRPFGWCRRHRRAGAARCRARVSVLPKRPRHYHRALACEVRRFGAAGAVPRDRGLRGLDPRIARPTRRRRALGAGSRGLAVRGSHARREPFRGLGGHGPRLAL